MVGGGGYGERRRRSCSAERERERERGRREPGRVRESRGRGVASSRASSEEGRPGKQASRWRGAVARARAGHTPLPLSRTKTTEEGGGLGRLLAGPASWLGCTGRSPGKLLPFIFFCFLISDICFDLNNILNHLFTLCQFLQELDILFQSSFIIGIIFGHILIYIINIFPMQIFMH